MLTVLVPVYKGSTVLSTALDSLVRQTDHDFTVLVGDDNNPRDNKEIEKIKKIVKNYEKKLSISYVKTPKNLGCQLHFQFLVDRVKTELLTFLAQDDIFSNDAISLIKKAFYDHPDVAALTRPYFWFFDDINHPIRCVPPINSYKNEVLRLTDGKKTITAVFGSVGQISGLAYRRRLIKERFHEDIFPGHIYPFADILKRHKVIMLKNYIVAVGTKESQSRKISSVYSESPTRQWLRMFDYVFKGDKYKESRKMGYEHILKNYEGLIQLKNYAPEGILEKEIKIMIQKRWKNVFNIKFWLYAIFSLTIPRSILQRLTDWYKDNILSRSIPEIKFKY